MIKTTNLSRVAKIIRFVLVLIVTYSWLNNTSRAESSGYKFIAQPKVELTPQRQEGLQWILDNWEKNYRNIFIELGEEALLNNHKVDFRNMEISLMVDEAGPKWSGFWALAIHGQYPGFGGDYLYYIELIRGQMILSRSYGIGGTIGGPPRGRYRDAFGDKSMSNFEVIQLVNCQIKFIAGIWTATNIPDSELFNKAFGFKFKWNGDEELSDAVHLKINLDQSCELITPHSGVNLNSWKGFITYIQAENFRVLRLNDTDEKNQGIKFREAKFISFSSEETLQIYAEGKSFEFKRILKSPLFKINDDSLNELRVGILQSNNNPIRTDE